MNRTGRRLIAALGWLRRLARNAGLWLLRRRYPGTAGGLRIVRVRAGPLSGRRMIVNLDPARGQVDTSYIYGYRQEAEQIAILAGLLRPGQTAWDVGIHRGVYTLLFADRVGPGGSVVAIDIDQRNCHVVAEATRLNGLANVAILNYGIGQECGAGTFISSPSSNSRISGTYRGYPTDAPVLTAGERVECVEMRTLDDLIETLGCPHLIKLDIDGAELEALDAAERVLACRNLILVVESHTPETDRRLTALLRRHDWAAYSIQERRLFDAGDVVWGTVIACSDRGRLEGLGRSRSRG
jgi:FkbM family methyltransferase